MLAILLIAPPLALLALGAPVLAIAATALPAGLGIEIFGVLWDTSLQQHIPIDRLSRVSSYDSLDSFVFIPIGLSVAGPVSEAIGVAETLWLAATIIVGTTLAVLLVADVRHLRRREPEPAYATAAP